MKFNYLIPFLILIMLISSCSLTHDSKLTDEECESFEMDNKFSCYFFKAISSREIQYCEFSGYLRDQCIVLFADMTDDYSLCENLVNSAPQDAKTQDELYREYYANLSGKCSMVRQIIQPLENREKYSKMTPVKEDKESCIKSVNYGLAIDTHNSSLCEKTYQAEECYFIVAKKTNDISLCNKISFPIEKEECILSAAFNLKDPSLCSEAHLTDMCKESIETNRRFDVSSFYRRYLVLNKICEFD